MKPKLKAIKLGSGFYNQALGGYNYNVVDAIADIVDNCITYKSKNVFIFYAFDNNKKPYIAIINDGIGMDEKEIDFSMQPGYAKKREDDDLGYFGTGLKAASLSQCKRFTVFSRKNNKESIRVWDSDTIDDAKELVIHTEKHSDTPNELLQWKQLKKDGTLILWEILHENDQYSETKELFFKKMYNLDSWLGLIFHKFIEGKMLKIFINEITEVKPQNPFDYGSESYNLGNWTLKDRNTTVNCYCVPFEKDKPLQLKQGLYIYRKDRLITKEGGWLNTGKKDTNSLNQLRIEVCLNDPENKWRVQVSKNSCEIPSGLISDLNSKVNSAVKEIVKIYQNKNIRKSKPRENKEKYQIKHIWKLSHIESDKVLLKIDREHPIIDELIKTLKKSSDKRYVIPATADLISSLLDMLEYDLPIANICEYQKENNIQSAKPLDNKKLENILRQYFMFCEGYTEKKINLLLTKFREQ